MGLILFQIHLFIESSLADSKQTHLNLTPMSSLMIFAVLWPKPNIPPAPPRVPPRVAPPCNTHKKHALFSLSHRLGCFFGGERGCFFGGERGFFFGGERGCLRTSKSLLFLLLILFCFRFLLKQPIFTRTKLSLSVNYWTKVGPGTGI